MKKSKRVRKPTTIPEPLLIEKDDVWKIVTVRRDRNVQIPETVLDPENATVLNNWLTDYLAWAKQKKGRNG